MSGLPRSQTKTVVPGARADDLHGLLRDQATGRDRLSLGLRLPSSARSHPSAVVQRRQERDLRFLLPLVSDLSETPVSAGRPLPVDHREARRDARFLRSRRRRGRSGGRRRRDARNRRQGHHLRASGSVRARATLDRGAARRSIGELVAQNSTQRVEDRARLGCRAAARSSRARGRRGRARRRRVAGLPEAAGQDRSARRRPRRSRAAPGPSAA